MAEKDSPEEFARRIKKRARGIEKNVRDTVRKAALAAERTAVLRTPVDTGYARLNWTVGLGAPVVKLIPVQLDLFSTSTKRMVNNIVLPRNRAVIQQFQLSDGAVYISNAVEYIVYLDRGSSQQAPKGMTRAALAAAKAVVKQAKVLSYGQRRGIQIKKTEG